MWFVTLGIIVPVQCIHSFDSSVRTWCVDRCCVTCGMLMPSYMTKNEIDCSIISIWRSLYSHYNLACSSYSRIWRISLCVLGLQIILIGGVGFWLVKILASIKKPAFYATPPYHKPEKVREE